MSDPAPAPVTFDVCVVGGGPAGATAARRLAELGHRVCVVERRAAPAARGVECLAPAVLDLLGRACPSLLSGLDVRTVPLVARWGGAERGAESSIVDRVDLDASLLRAAVAAGARLVRPASVARPQRTDGGWRVPVDVPGGSVEVRSPVLVDARGRLARFPAGPRSAGVATTALVGTWHDVPGAVPGVVVEAGRSEWTWSTATGDGRVTAAVFVDRSRAAGAGTARRAELYRSLLSGFRGTAHVVERGRLVRSGVRDATASVAAEPVDTTSIRVGDAALRIDPLSAQGVQTAMVGALQAAAVVNTVLRRPADAGLAIRFFSERTAFVAGHHAALAAAEYRAQAAVEDTAFWRARAAGPGGPEQAGAGHDTVPSPDVDGSTLVRRSPHATLETTPVLADDFVTAGSAVRAPRLGAPVAYVGGVAVAPLVAGVRSDVAVSDLLAGWSRLVGRQRSREVLAWMLRSGVLVGAG